MESTLKDKTLKVIILSQLLIEANDDIKLTPIYKGKLKVFGKQYINQLGLAIKQMDTVYQADPEMMTNVMANFEQLAETLVNLDVHGMVMINQIYQHYKDNREEWIKKFKVEVKKLDS